MRKYFCYISLIVLSLLNYSCELDNYEAPNASIHGVIYDSETNEPILQDIYLGSQIEYIEHGFDNPEIQYMIFKCDGSYRNDLMFANTYTIQPVRGNFVSLEAQEVKVEGDTQLDFYALPYIRIKNAEIKREQNNIVATFNMQTTLDSNVSKIALFVHVEPHLGANLYQVATILDLNQKADENQLYTVTLNLDDYWSTLKVGQSYYFRVGALIDAPEAKYNYAPMVRLTL